MVLEGRLTLLRITKIKEGRRKEEWEKHLKSGVGGKNSPPDKDKGRKESNVEGRGGK